MDGRVLEYRRMVLHLAEQLTQDDRKKLAYIFSVPESNESSGILTTMKYLESRMVYSQSNPEGLMFIAKMVDREDLVQPLMRKIKDYHHMAVQEETVTTTHSCGLTLHHPELQWHLDSALNLTPSTVEHLLAIRSLLFRVACSSPSLLEAAKAVDSHLQAAEERYWEASWELQKVLKVVGRQPEEGIPLTPQGKGQTKGGVVHVSTKDALNERTSSE